MNARLHELQRAGVSIWLDTLSRDLLDSGAFAHLIADSAVTGATSNPRIFAKAITSSNRYDAQLRDAAPAGIDSTQELFFELALDDIHQAADLLRPAYYASQGRDGFVSFECTPDLADDTAATIAQATELWSRLARPNVMIKVPATAAGIPAIEALTAARVNVNATLLFSVERYEQVIDAYLAGLERRLAAGQPVDSIASVASFFVSRVDSKADGPTARLGPARARRRRERPARPRPLSRALHRRPLAPATRRRRPPAATAVGKHRDQGPRLLGRPLRRAADRPRRRHTMPEATLRAFADHGEIGSPMDADALDAEETVRRAEPAGIDLAALTAELEADGVRSFCDSYHELLSCIEAKLA